MASSKESMEAILRTRVRESRPRLWLVGLIFVLLMVIPVVFFLWYFWPEPEPRRFQIIAIDGIVNADSKTAQLHARLLPIDGESQPEKGLVVTEQSLRPKPKEELFQLVLEKVEDSDLRVDIPVQTSLGQRRFLLRYNPKNREFCADDSCDLFIVSKETPLILVDLRLLANNPDKKASEDLNQAIEVLQKLSTECQVQPIYLDFASEDYKQYRESRSRLFSFQSAKLQRLPAGPVLPMSIEGELDRDKLVSSLRNSQRKGIWFLTNSLPENEPDMDIIVITRPSDLPKNANLFAVENWSDVPAVIKSKLKN